MGMHDDISHQSRSPTRVPPVQSTSENERKSTKHAKHTRKMHERNTKDTRKMHENHTKLTKKCRTAAWAARASAPFSRAFMTKMQGKSRKFSKFRLKLTDKCTERNAPCSSFSRAIWPLLARSSCDFQHDFRSFSGVFRRFQEFLTFKTQKSGAYSISIEEFLGGKCNKNTEKRGEK